jgi:REP element-mobilizing transposase RayT
VYNLPTGRQVSNHVHFIGRAEEGFELSNILRDFKRHTSKAVLKAIEDNPRESRKEWMLSIFKKSGEHNSNNVKYHFWRQDNKPIEITSNKVIDIKLNYIHNNPVEEGIVVRPEDYKYSSAIDYAGAVGELSNISVLK